MKQNRGFLSLLIVAGSFLIYRNRFQLQRFLESRGIRVPLLKGSVGESVQSGIAKIAGKTEFKSDQVRKAV